MFVDKRGCQVWLSKWDGFQGAVNESVQKAFTFHWPETAQRAGVKLVQKFDMLSYKVLEVVKDRDGEIKAEVVS